MDGWIDGVMEGWMERWRDRGKDGWLDDWMVRVFRRRQWHGSVGLSAAGFCGGCEIFGGKIARCPQN